VFDGRIAASMLHGEGVHAVSLRLDGAMLRMPDSAATGPARSFVRARGTACP
jgi:hypothetical protein